MQQLMRFSDGGCWGTSYVEQNANKRSKICASKCEMGCTLCVSIR